MKQILQNYKTGKLTIQDVPAPLLKPNGILVRNRSSLISTGTERMKIETASKNIVAKAKARPDQVRLVLNNLKQEGFLATFKKAFLKLDTPISLGYSCAGDVDSVGSGVKGFYPGDRVACVGEGFATHAEVNFVPDRLAVKIPHNLTYQEASFCGLGAIAMQGVMNANLCKEAKIGVIGLGLLGQLALRILRACNFSVIGIDIDDKKIEIARKAGFSYLGNSLDDDIYALAKDFTEGQGLDAVIITAVSSNNKPIESAGRIAKQYGQVVLVGMVPIEIPRKDFFDKELIFVVSHGFGDESIEKGIEVNSRKIRPAKNNVGRFLELVSNKKIELKDLISAEFNLNQAREAYRLVRDKERGTLGIILNYGFSFKPEDKIGLSSGSQKRSKKAVSISFIGAGSFSLGYLLPIFSKNKQVYLKGVAAARGISSENAARKFNFEYAASDNRQILDDSGADCIVIATRHNLHSYFVIEALKRKKAVFVEKPLCSSFQELEEIIKIHKEFKGKVMIGFNRRFSPFVVKLKEFFSNRIGPLMINYRVNAGSLGKSHWLKDLNEGGGRIIGEVCHFVDLLQFITGSRPKEIFAQTIEDKGGVKTENLVVTIKFADNSIGTINYNAIGDVSWPRERIEVFGQDSVGVIDNFKECELIRKSKNKRVFKFNRDMGHKNEINTFIDCLVERKKIPIEFKEIVCSTYATLKIIESLESNLPVKVEPKELIC